MTDSLCSKNTDVKWRVDDLDRKISGMICWHVYVFECACRRVRERSKVDLCLCLFTFLHIYVYIYINTYLHTYIYIYMYTSIHMYIHIYIYVCIYIFTCSRKYSIAALRPFDHSPCNISVAATYRFSCRNM